MTTWAPPSNVANGTSDAVMDTWFLGILAKERNREMLGRLEDTLASFVKDDAIERLEFPPKSAFQRKIFHRVALYYGLDHKILELDGAAASEGMRSLVLFKTGLSGTPKVRLCDMDLDIVRKKLLETAENGAVNEKESNGAHLGSKVNSDAGSSTATKNAKPSVFLRRPRSDSSLYKGAGGRGSGAGGSKLKSVSEAEYEQARARIFKKDSKSRPPLADRPPRSSRAVAEPRVKMALGPVEGTNGFAGRGRGSRPTVSANVSPALSLEKVRDNTAETRRKGTSGSFGTGGARNPGKKESPSLESSDLNDPDFDRRYSRWASPQGSIQPPQIVSNAQGAPYFHMQSYSNFDFQSSPLPHHLRQQPTSQHQPHHQVFPGMMTGRGDHELSMGWGIPTTTGMNQQDVPRFNIETMSDFPSLTQAHEMNRKRNDPQR